MHRFMNHLDELAGLDVVMARRARSTDGATVPEAARNGLVKALEMLRGRGERSAVRLARCCGPHATNTHRSPDTDTRSHPHVPSSRDLFHTR